MSTLLNFIIFCFQFRCFLSFTSRYVNARVEHYTGKIVVNVKSSEGPLKKHLFRFEKNKFKKGPKFIDLKKQIKNFILYFSMKDSSAVINVARLLADRCHKYGITQMKFFEDIHFDKSTKVRKKY